MGKLFKRVLLLVLVGVFVFSCAAIALKQYSDRKTARQYAETAERFASAVPAAVPERVDTAEVTPADGRPTAPIQVDFEALRALNPDIVGWLYCADTTIDYPVLQGTSNDTYLRHLYDGSYSVAGSLFIDAGNRADFGDANTILYGHYMTDGTMFGGLDAWNGQDYCEQHPHLWLLTPGGEYRVDVFAAGYTTADSDAYRLLPDAGPELDEYLAAAVVRSAIQTTVAPAPDARYLLLSTCAGVADTNERFVVHGMLVPAKAAGE